MNFLIRHCNITLAVVSVILITIFSTCSPLYPLNPWDDPQVFMTMGKSVLSGKLMYHDLYDQKGPVLFFLHMWAAFLSRSSFFGIYLLEIICMYGFMHYGYKIMLLYTEDNSDRKLSHSNRGISIALPMMCTIGLVTVSSDFYYYGDSVEEFCLPVLAHALWLMVRYAKIGRLPSMAQTLFMGIGAGLIFWTKFNITVFFYGGAFITLLCIAYRRRQLTELSKTVMWIFAGMIGVSVLVLAYFALHGTLTDLFQCYFYNNIFLYGGSMANGEPTQWWFPLVKLTIWFGLMLPVLFAKVERNIKVLIMMTYGSLVLSFTLMTVQLYYFVLCFAFFPMLICYFPKTTLGMKSTCVMVALAIWQTIFNWNIVTLVMGTFPTQSLRIAEIVDRNTTTDSKVLTFSSYDTGIYVFSHQLPPNKHFFLPNILSPEIKKEQASYVASGDIKYLARWTGFVKTTHDYYAAPIPKNYHLIYDGTENYRYRFLTSPIMYLWNLIWTRPIMSLFCHPDVQPEHMLLYERRP